MAYGLKKDPLHFRHEAAAQAMDQELGRDLTGRRVGHQGTAAGAEHRSVQASDAPWVAIVVCAGWNCGETDRGACRGVCDIKTCSLSTVDARAAGAVSARQGQVAVAESGA